MHIPAGTEATLARCSRGSGCGSYDGVGRVDGVSPPTVATCDYLCRAASCCKPCLHCIWLALEALSARLQMEPVADRVLVRPREEEKVRIQNLPACCQAQLPGDVCTHCGPPYTTFVFVMRNSRLTKAVVCRKHPAGSSCL